LLQNIPFFPNKNHNNAKFCTPKKDIELGYWFTLGPTMHVTLVNRVWPVPLAQVLSRSQLIFSFQNLVFQILFEFSVAEIT
jgi:hypothetical protein